MASFGGKSSKDKQTTEKLSQRNSMSSTQSSDTTKLLEGFQSTLTDIQKRMINIERAQSSVDELRKDIYDPDGIEHRLKIVCDEFGENTSEIEELRKSNKYLRDEVDLLRDVVIRMDRRMEEISKEVVQLRGRSMRDNILIHEFSQFPNEDLYRSVPESIKKYFGINVKFTIIHRNGKPRSNGKTVTITAKLTDRTQKDSILKAQRAKKDAGVKVPFFITAQEPAEVAEERKRLYNVSDKLRQKGVNARVVKNQLIMPDGKVHEDSVKPVTNADVLQINQFEIEELQEVPTVTTYFTEIRGNYLFATAGKVKSDNDVNNVYKKACLLKDSASSDHRTLIYRYRSDNGEDCDGFYDDGEHDTGRRMLKYMKDRNISDTAIVITRWNGSYIGFEKFRAMEKLISDAVQMFTNTEPKTV